MNINLCMGAMPRSGSTLLGMILGTNRKIFYMGESSFWGNFVPGQSKCSCGSSNCQFLNDIWRRVSVSENIMSISGVCARLDTLPYFSEVLMDDDMLQGVNTACVGFCELANIFRDKVAKRVVVDSSANVRIAEALHKSCGWKVLLLTRDPRGIINSFKKANLRHGVDRALPQQINLLIDFAQNIKRMMGGEGTIFMRYEDLCQQPKVELARLCDFLGVEFDNDMFKFRSGINHIVMGNRMRFGGSEDIIEDLSWKHDLSDMEKNIICSNSRLWDLYANFGYQLTSGSL